MRFLFRQLSYDLNANLLLRPTLWLGACVFLAFGLPVVERGWLREIPAARPILELLRLEPSTAQTLLSTLAGSMMSVVSVVYSILLVALSLASMQFSTRILAGFVRDRFSQQVLGLFIGTFAYCLTLLRSIQSDPADVPGMAVAFAMLLALLSLGSLVLFIHHMVMGIQANVIVDRIATETEGVIAAVFPDKAETEVAGEGSGHRQVFAPKAGYLQLIDTEGMLRLSGGQAIELLRPMGSFVTRETALFRVDTPPALDAELVGMVDIGPFRTMQDDAEFGFRQIVDIGLKAISPAINDPSTGATCIDHLGRLLGEVARRYPPRRRYGARGNLVIPNTSFSDLLDLSVDQLRQYGKADMAICLRLMRMLGDLAPFVRESADRDRLHQHARMVLESAVKHFPELDCTELHRRHAVILGKPPATTE